MRRMADIGDGDAFPPADLPPAAGRLLVATPVITESPFARAVVLLLDHDADGSVGVVLNRPTGVGVDAVLPGWGAHLTGPPVVFQGGPVALDSALGVAAVPVVPSTQLPPGLRPLESTGGSGSSLGLVDLDAPPDELGRLVPAMRIFVGYSGWDAGQLVEEVAQGAWVVVAAAPDDAFTVDPEGMWRAVLRRQAGAAALLSTYPDDPSQN